MKVCEIAHCDDIELETVELSFLSFEVGTDSSHLLPWDTLIVDVFIENIHGLLADIYTNQ